MQVFSILLTGFVLRALLSDLRLELQKYLDPNLMTKDSIGVGRLAAL